MSKDTATFSRDSARRISDVVREVERSRTVAPDRAGRGPRPTYDNPVRGRQFVGEIVGEGPGGEDDRTGPLYWVREISLASMEPVVGGRWLIAMNLCEIDSPHHILRNTVLGEEIPKRLVVVTVIDATLAFGHVFNSYPGQMTDLWGYKVDCIDENGCPEGEWYQMYGPGFVDTTRPPACEPEPEP